MTSSGTGFVGIGANFLIAHESVAIGNGVKVTGWDSVAIGYQSNVDGMNGVVIGQQARAYPKFSSYLKLLSVF